MKRPVWIAFSLTIVVLLVLGYLWFFGFQKRSSVVGSVTRLQYFEEPAMLAVHVESPVGVFVIPTMSPTHAAELRSFIDPALIELESVNLNATTLHDQWSDHTERHDILQFGVYGNPRGGAKPDYGDKVSIGSTVEYPYQTFRWMTPGEFAKVPAGTPVTDVKIYGRALFSNYHHVGFRKKPFVVP